jgi:hypothetical protein
MGQTSTPAASRGQPRGRRVRMSSKPRIPVIESGQNSQGRHHSLDWSSSGVPSQNQRIRWSVKFENFAGSRRTNSSASVRAHIGILGREAQCRKLR